MHDMFASLDQHVHCRWWSATIATRSWSREIFWSTLSLRIRTHRCVTAFTQVTHMVALFCRRLWSPYFRSRCGFDAQFGARMQRSADGGLEAACANLYVIEEGMVQLEHNGQKL